MTGPFSSVPLPSQRAARPGTSPKTILREVFGLDDFRSLQEDVIRSLVEGRDVLAVMATGGGKSLCYQIPALTRQGTAVVVSPLLALMKDQVDALRRKGVRAAALVGHASQSASERMEIEKLLRQGHLDIVYVSPERFETVEFQSLAAACSVSFVAIDEAHCVIEWGHDFRPSYIRLQKTLARMEHAPRLAVTATASRDGRSEISNRLLRDPEVFVGSADRPNLVLRADRVRRPLAAVVTSLQGAAARGSSLVYCRTREDCESVASRLAHAGLRAAAYHAGLEGAERTEIQDRFLGGQLDVVAATTAFGMGVDAATIGTVINAGLPESLEDLIQQSGRSGRDGRPAMSILLWSEQEYRQRKVLLEREPDAVASRRKRARLELLMSYARSPGCRNAILVRRFGAPGPQTCGHCDRCLNPPAHFDGSEVGRAMLTILRRHGSVSPGFLSDVLSGSETERVRASGAQRTSQFGCIPSGKSAATAIVHQALALDLLDLDVERGKLVPGGAAPSLANGAQVWFVDPAAASSAETEAVPSGLPEWRVDLWKELRTARADVASRLGMRPDECLSDAILNRLIETASEPETWPMLLTGLTTELADLIAEIGQTARKPQRQPEAFSVDLF